MVRDSSINFSPSVLIIQQLIFCWKYSQRSENESRLIRLILALQLVLNSVVSQRRISREFFIEAILCLF